MNSSKYPIKIPYESRNFPPKAIRYRGNLCVTWGDILWAAVTVGRPSRNAVFRHGESSWYEAVFRWSLTRMALERSSSWTHRLQRTQAAKTMDPTEKGAVNYFLDMTICKLFAHKFLKIPWLLHLDVCRPKLNPVLQGISRPDLVGQDQNGLRWHAFECKGRANVPDGRTLKKAKDQAQRVISVNGSNCNFNMAAITYFKRDILHFLWCDPDPDSADGFSVEFEPSAWRNYYEPFVGALLHANGEIPEAGQPVPVEELDVKIGVHPEIAKHLREEQWLEAKNTADDLFGESDGMASVSRYGGETAQFQRDGLYVCAGKSWEERYKEYWEE